VEKLYEGTGGKSPERNQWGWEGNEELRYPKKKEKKAKKALQKTYRSGCRRKGKRGALARLPAIKLGYQLEDLKRPHWWSYYSLPERRAGDDRNDAGRC